MDLTTQILLIYPTAKPQIDFTIFADANGTQIIGSWSFSQPQPTSDQLAAVAIQADLLDRTNKILQTRIGLYSPITEYMDAFCKIYGAGNDAATVAAGQAQLTATATHDMQVKVNNPKPTV